MTDGPRYWMITGVAESRRPPAWKTTTVAPDGDTGTALRHHWSTRSGADWLTVIGPGIDEAMVEYRRLAGERRAEGAA